MPQLYEHLKGGSLSVAKPITHGYKGEKFLLLCLLALLIFYFHSFHGMMRADQEVAGSGLFIINK